MRLYVIVEDRFPVSDRALLHWPVVRSARDRVAARPAAPPAAATSSESNARSPGASAGMVPHRTAPGECDLGRRRVRRDGYRAVAQSLEHGREAHRDRAVRGRRDGLSGATVRQANSAAPASATEAIERFTPPVFVTCSGNVATAPMVNVPKSRFVASSAATATGSVVPVPPRAIVFGAFDAFDASDRLALAGLDPAVGVNTTVIAQVAAGASAPPQVVAVEKRAASGPESVSAPTLTDALPVFFTTTTSGPLATLRVCGPKVSPFGTCESSSVGADRGPADVHRVGVRARAQVAQADEAVAQVAASEILGERHVEEGRDRERVGTRRQHAGDERRIAAQRLGRARRAGTVIVRREERRGRVLPDPLKSVT